METSSNKFNHFFMQQCNSASRSLRGFQCCSSEPKVTFDYHTMCLVPVAERTMLLTSYFCYLCYF